MSIFGGLLGGGLSLVGGLLGASGARDAANAQTAAAREALQFQNNQMGQGRLAQLALAFGPQEAERIIRATLPRDQVERLFGRAATAPGFTVDQQQQLDRLNSQIATREASGQRRTGFSNAGASDPELTRLRSERDALLRVTGGDPGVTGEVDMEALRGLGPGVYQQYDSLLSQLRGQGDTALSDYDSATGTLRREAGGIERDARRFGRGQIERINRDSSRALENANNMAQASLLSRGMGASSLLANSLGQNAVESERARADAISGVEDQQSRLLTGIRQGNLGLLSQRLGARTPLLLSNQDRETSLQSSLLGSKLGLLTGPSSNPWLGQSAQSYFPGVSGSAAAQQSIGNSLTAIGGPLLGYGMGNFFGGGGNTQSNWMADPSNPYIQGPPSRP